MNSSLTFPPFQFSLNKRGARITECYPQPQPAGEQSNIEVGTIEMLAEPCCRTETREIQCSPQAVFHLHTEILSIKYINREQVFLPSQIALK